MSKWIQFRDSILSANYILALMAWSASICLLCSVLIWFSENDQGSVVTYLDSLFMAVSAYTASGLGTVNYCKFNPVTKMLLGGTVQLGSTVLLSAIPSAIRFRQYRVERSRLNARLRGCSSADEATIFLRLQQVEEHVNVCGWIMAICVIYTFSMELLFSFLLLPSMTNYWWALFMSVSCFNNAGLSLSPTSFMDWVNDSYAITVFVILMPIGNTLFPLCFRTIVWLACKLIRQVDGSLVICGHSVGSHQQALKALLSHPRKYYSHMFSFKDTLVLFGLWGLLTLTEFLMFIPDYNTSIFPKVSTGQQILIALFQTVTVRTSGFTILELTAFRIGHLSFWVLAMYISAYPLILSTRVSSNKNDEDHHDGITEYKHQAVSVLGRDLLWLYIAMVAISWIEDQRLDSLGFPSGFMRICFEVLSAFGNVGLSLPLPSSPDTSFSGALSSASKILIVLCMYCGKHRGLPPSVDEAIRIHHVQLQFREVEEMSSSDDEASPQPKPESEMKTCLNLVEEGSFVLPANDKMREPEANGPDSNCHDEANKLSPSTHSGDERLSLQGSGMIYSFEIKGTVLDEQKDSTDRAMATPLLNKTAIE